MKVNHKRISIAVGIYMVIGAILGIYGTCKFIAKAWDYPNILWMGFVFGVLYMLVGASGYRLIRTQKVSPLTILTQAMQVAGFSALGIKYQFCAGPSFKIGYQARNIISKIEPMNVEFTLGINPTLTFFYINLIPLIISFYFIYRIKEEPFG